LVFQLIAIFSLLIKGPIAGVIFVLSSILNLFLSLRGIQRPVTRPEVLSEKVMVQFDWIKVLPLWNDFRLWTEKHNADWLSLDRKTKVLFVRDRAEWLRVLALFPLNIRNWKVIEILPERLPITTPEGVRIAYCDYFGFWRYQDNRSLVPDERSLHLHKTYRDWQDYPYRIGGKRKWKGESRDGATFSAGPTNEKGTTLWID
jgi:hypothetical protein